jgi:hypothetical protein
MNRVWWFGFSISCINKRLNIHLWMGIIHVSVVLYILVVWSIPLRVACEAGHIPVGTG